ncbi:MAG: glycosyltransferase family A protein [Planctomycetota bacterium]|nr:glycosyltransferase family A protein [Planctomycetota bacterium]
MTAFRFIVAAYKCGPWVDRCLASVRTQRHADWRLILIDDQSPDDTYEQAVKAARGDPRIVVERSPERRLSLWNTKVGIETISDDPEDVIVTLDGDDWLAHDGVLDVLEQVYRDPEVWLTYGSHRRWKNRLLHRLGLKVKRGIAREIPPAIARAGYFRQYEFVSSHLRSFKRFLWDGIRDEDLRDDDGQYWQAAPDHAFMFPLLEMAGAERIRYLEEMLYVYNNSNPLSEHRSIPDAQLLAACKMRAKEPYARLEQRPTPRGEA